ncbi:MAG: amidohydrolase family protein [Methanospirillaceae archaeon]|nr:amidohydrolase family protein [Methanospirillaceae archaeon]
MDTETLVLTDLHLPGGRVADITIRNGIVSHVGSSEPADTKISCSRYLVLPAAVDLHVHMRGGNEQKQKEDWTTGTQSALAGGVTVVVDQPNTIPPLTNAASFHTRLFEAKTNAWCNFAINAGVTADSDISGLWKSGALHFGETFAGPSSYGEAVSQEVLSRALSEIAGLGGLASIHAETVSSGKDSDLFSHHALRCPDGEAEAVRLVHHCNGQHCRLYFCHVSSGTGMDAIRDAIIEVTPHHLLLSLPGREPADTRFLVNPPIRPEYDRKELWKRWNRIDVIASDHAPHTTAEKSGDFSSAPSGIPGVETMVPLLLAYMTDKQIPLSDLVAKTSYNPSRIAGILPAGFKPGNRADFALYPHSRTVVDPDLLHSKAKWTPFEGMEAVFPEVVIRDGKVAYRDGSFCYHAPHWISGRGYIPETRIE